MLLMELFQGHDERVVRHLKKLTSGSGDHDEHQVNAIVGYALRAWPDCVYRGPLFRVLDLKPQDILGSRSNEDVLKFIKGYGSKRDGSMDDRKGRIYFSHAKSAKGIDQFVDIGRSMGSGEYENHNAETIKVKVITQQMGYGLDLGKVFAKFADDLGYSSENEAAVVVGEVLAPMDQSLDIKLYHVIGLGKRFMSNAMIKDETQDDEDPEEGRKYLKSLRIEKDLYFRSDQFRQLQQTLQFQYGQNKPTVVKPIKVDRRAAAG